MRRKVNVKFLGCFLLALLVLGGGVHLVHALQVKSNASGLRRQADLAQEQDRPEEAIKYLKRYLGYVPDDVDALAMLGLTLEKQTKTLKERRNVFLLLEEVLRKAPERRDVRERQVRLAMEVGRYDPGRYTDAAYHLEYLLRESSPRDGEWEELLGRCSEAKAEYTKAVTWYEKAIKHAPQKVETYVALSRVLRHQLKQEERANKVLDELVKANEQAPAAYLARASERRKAGQPAEASEDVTRAFQLAPSDVDVLLASAESAAAAGKPEEARGYLQRAIDRHAQNPRVYLSLADVELQTGRSEEAVACLRQGVKALPENKELEQALATVLIQVGKLAEAGEVIAGLRQGKTPQVWLDFLDARILVHKGEWASATRSLERIRPQLAQLAAADLLRQVDLLLAGCYEQRGETDRQIAALRRALTVDPLWIPARLGLGAVLAATGKLDEALKEYQQVLTRLPAVAPLMARLLMARNLRLPAGQQDWQPVEQLLDNAAKTLPNSTDVLLARAEALAAQGQSPKAKQILEKVRDQKPNLIEVWLALAGLAEREKPEKGLEILAEAERRLGDRVEFRLARLRYWSRRTGAETTAALTRLGQDLDKFSKDDQARLGRALAEISYRLGDVQEAQRLWTQVAELQKGDVRVRLYLFDIALAEGKEETVNRLLDEIRGLEGEDGLMWRYCEVCRLISRARQGDKQGLDEARKLLAKVAVQRPSWAALALREAEIHELEGNADRAVEDYLKAIEAGEQSPHVVRRTMQLLFERRRTNDLQRLVRKLPPQSLAAPELQRYVSRVALEAQDKERALESAKAAAAGSKDYHDQLWLAQVLLLAGKKDEVEVPLRQAVQLAPQVPLPWVSLVQHLVRIGQVDKANAALREAQQQLPPEQAPLALAQCYEAVGELPRAEDQYRKALAAKPEDLGLLRTLAAFYQRHNAHPQAEPHLRKILDPQSKASQAEAAWARRTLAMGLVASGGYPKFRDAMALLEENLQADKGSAEDQRTKAALLATQPNSRKEAIRLLEDLIGRRLENLEDQFLLAQLYEADRNWVKARERLLGVLTAPQGETPVHLAYCVSSLLRHDQAEEARVWLDKLEKQQPKALRTAELKTRVLKALGQVNEAVAYVKAYAQTPGVPVEVVALLYEELGQNAAAEEQYRRYAAQATRPESMLILATFLGRQNRVGEGLDVCAKVVDKCAPEAFALGSVDVVRSGVASAEHYERVEGWLKAIIAKNPKATGPLVIFGDLRYLQGRYAEAGSLYRQVLALEPNNASGLNNLAWLVALESGKGDEALELIKRGMEIAGPLPAFLDTRGMIYLTLGLGDLAVNDLEEAVAASPSASRYFHLAQAYQKARNRIAADSAWRKARTLGLNAQTLGRLEQAAFQRLLEELEPKR